jgi:hypothetical protein
LSALVWKIKFLENYTEHIKNEEEEIKKERKIDRERRGRKTDRERRGRKTDRERRGRKTDRERREIKKERIIRTEKQLIFVHPSLFMSSMKI